nr:alpha-mannosidase [Clostridia bacterium]
MSNKKHIYLVGNAHLDPIWQWRWQEGSAEAKATIRSALDRMNEFDDFVFVCSSASVYRWIEEFDPDMFEEIKARVKEGRFVIVGGMNVQPDCNLPTGEGFARQTLYSQRYFMEKFGITAKTGYNVDSFGHNAMLPQILRKSGMENYVFMRPGPHENALSSDLFNWVSPDGSSVLTHRIYGAYGYRFSTCEELCELLRRHEDNILTNSDAYPFFYGVGNHGGGPTIRNLELLREYAEKNPDVQLHYSNLADFFDYLRASGIEIPEHRDDLQHHAPGCYATISEIKNNIRRAEYNLCASEMYSVLSQKLLGRKYPTAKFEDAWNDITFLHFHDSMDGCSIFEAYEDARYMAGSALNTAAVAENNALQSISWAVDTSADKDKGLPLFIFNPHSFDVEEVVQINKTGAGIVDADGNSVPSQNVLSSTLECYWREDIAFKAKVPALGWSVYYLKEGGAVPNDTENSAVKATEAKGPRTANSHECTILENEYYTIGFEPYSGYITTFKSKATGEELINGRSAVP